LEKCERSLGRKQMRTRDLPFWVDFRFSSSFLGVSVGVGVCDFLAAKFKRL